VCSHAAFERICEKEGASYVQCGKCGTVRQFPYPDTQAIVRFYENYQSRKSQASVYLTQAGYEAYARDKRLTFADLGVEASLFAGKRICDVGCGIGQFLEVVKDFGPAQAFGLDLSEECVNSALSRGLDVGSDDFLSLRQSFDVISMWHVVEHLLDPRAFVEHAYRQLVPGGSLLVETPVVGPISAAFGQDWRFFMPTEHVNLFTAEGLVALCEQSGFTFHASVRFGSGNDSGAVPPANKRAMDRLAKSLQIGDTMAAWFVKDGVRHA
jgi:SAM-dependent methyltransferase